VFGGVSRSRLRGNRTSGNGYSAQNSNFGIGLESTGTNDNIVEDNTVVGNTNGLFLTATVQGNVIRRNVVIGNPPAQMAVDHTSNGGFDIKNLSPPGQNSFTGNVCLTAMNAPCPAPFESSLTASPNPIPVTGAAFLGMTTISWMAPGAGAVEVRVGSPNGALFAAGGSRGSAQTRLWVPDGMTFYLQDISGGKPLTEENTIATVVVRLQRR
jgi:parallel beta-helix repeat protein